MRRIVYSASARQDLASILGYITRESGTLATGLRFTSQVRLKCGKIASLPGAFGRARPELRPDVRSFAFKGYVIFFRYDGDIFHVVNILEGHRDIVSYFDDDKA